MTDYELLREPLIAGVDTRLGDSITYVTGGQPRVIPGYITGTGDEGGADGISPLPSRRYVKIACIYLPDAGPQRADRLTALVLPGVWKPAVTADMAEGADWIFEIQKAGS